MTTPDTTDSRSTTVMDLHAAIRTRRSVRQFTDRALTREQIEPLLQAATHAPNHRMTQPWRFYVLGPESRRAYAAVIGARKAARVEDPNAAQAVIDKVTAAAAALPAQIAVTMVLSENPEIREEDYAATMMAVQNVLLTAHAMGFASHLKSGAVMEDPRARLALGIPDQERLVIMIDLGEPVGVPESKPRRSATELTTWLP